MTKDEGLVSAALSLASALNYILTEMFYIPSNVASRWKNKQVWAKMLLEDVILNDNVFETFCSSFSVFIYVREIRNVLHVLIG